MGREARMNAARAVDLSARETFWRVCVVCGLDFPTQWRPDAHVEHLDACQRCCVADLATLMRSHPGTVAMLPVVRALQGKSQVELKTWEGMA